MDEVSLPSKDVVSSTKTEKLINFDVFQLMVDLTKAAILRPIIDDGAGDIPLWNKEIAQVSRGEGITGRWRRRRDRRTLPPPFELPSVLWTTNEILIKPLSSSYISSHSVLPRKVLPFRTMVSFRSNFRSF